MSDTATSEGRPAGANREELSTLFAYLVMQQSNMALMLLGKTAHPETGQVIKDVEAAKLFIDQLEMLEVKTKGNLTKEEDGLLRQTLMTLRLAFVEAIESTPAKSQPAPQAAEATPAPESKAPESSGSAPAQEEHPKKFSKKY